ncbi:MAG: hypothetical protein ACK4UL_11980 [Novosphingobium meiothermophilum]|uniref:hypothetical protein n=1 Tax=Novosphingobium TaxID=165696 RepID=UPI000D6E7357|nr:MULTISPECIES: hypothetical protein [Novosphingobium]
MLSRLPANIIGRFWAFVLALTVLAHATMPFEAPLQARSGSAFSAATTELAVAPQRNTGVQRAMLPIAPPPPQMPAMAAPVAAPLARQTASFWPPQTAPPAPAPLLLRPAPRAPPLA